MSEAKQFTFRLNAESVETFRKYCEENHLTSAQGFDRLLNTLSVELAQKNFEQELASHTKEKDAIIEELLQMLVEYRTELKKFKAKAK